MTSFGFFADWQVGIALLWLLYRAALRGRIPHGAARAYLLLVVPVAAGIAALKLPVLAPVVLYVATAAVETTTATPMAAAAIETSVDGLALGYWTVATVLALLFVVGAVRWVVRWRQGIECGGVRFCPQGKAVASSLFGRVAVDPKCLTSDALESILAHERAHVAHKHSWDLLYMSLLRAALWLNPIVWLVVRDLRLVHEAQADAAVLNGGFSPQRYLHTLLDAEIGAIGGSIPGNFAPIHCFGFCSTKKRIEMMTKLFPSRRSLWRLTAAVPVVGAMLVLFSFTRPVVVAESPKTTTLNEVTKSADPVLVLLFAKTSDGKEVPIGISGSLQGLDPKTIASMTVIKGESAVDVYWKDATPEVRAVVASDGLILITLKKTVDSDPAKRGFLSRHLTEEQIPVVKAFMRSIEANNVEYAK